MERNDYIHIFNKFLENKADIIELVSGRGKGKYKFQK